MTARSAPDPVFELFRREILTNSASLLVSPDIYGRTYSFRQVRGLLAQTNAGSALEVMALLNAVAPELTKLGRLDTPENARHLDNLYRFLFSPRPRRRATIEWRRSLGLPGDLFTPLSPWACAALTDCCLRFGHLDRGAGVSPPRETDYFGRMLLSFQDRLLPPGAITDDIDPAALSEFQFAAVTRNYAYSNLHIEEYGSDYVRLYALFEIPAIGEVLQAREGVTPAEWFRANVGMSPADYRFTVMALMGAAQGCSLANPNTARLIFNVDRMTANLTPASRESFIRLNELAVIDVPGTRAAKPPTDWRSAVYLTNVLARRQLLRVGAGTYLILHRRLFLERYFHGLVHLLDDGARNGVVRTRWQQVRSVFGHIFEGYLRWLLRSFFAGSPARYGEVLNRTGDTDALVLIGRTALVFESNHHYLSGPERYDATAATLAAIIKPDLDKAISTATAVANGLVSIDGRAVQVDEVLPIAVLPDALPINLINNPTFQRTLADAVPWLDGDGARILPAQVLTQSHLELFDRVWRLPAEVPALLEHLKRRARSVSFRFTSSRYERPRFELRVVHDGNVLGPVEEAAHQDFREHGPGRFMPRPGGSGGA